MTIFQKFHQFLHPSHFNDTQLVRTRKLHAGHVSCGTKVAIYLIFPSEGFLDSHQVALIELVRAGYAPLVVSNLSLTPQMLLCLEPVCWQIIERENFGYDFGGYREAILWLASQFNVLDRVILMNDSVWFPIPGAMDWIAVAESLDVDLAGSLCTGFSGRVRVHQFRTTPWEVDMRRSKLHYGSFALMLSGRLLRDTGFLQFWQKLRLSQGKNRTIKRGEIGLTQWVIRHGFSHAATSNVTRLDQILAALSDAKLEEIFANLIIVQDDKADRQRSSLALPKLGRSEKEAFIRMVVARRGPLLSMPALMHDFFHFAFLKKYALKSAPDQAVKLVPVINGLQEPMRSIIFAETGLVPPQAF